MARQRKYLDRGRQIALEDRALDAEWEVLLRFGRRAVMKGRADDRRVLDEVMWQGAARSRTARPASMDHPLMRRWLEHDEQQALAYLRQHWGMNRAPEDRAEALIMLSHPGCPAVGLGHRIRAAQAKQNDWREIWWEVGVCGDCFRALLMRYDAKDGTAQTWLFYDQETA